MTLPQDQRSPHRQARWLEIENVGSVEIPAFGACELVDSVRVEPFGYTPGDGRIVYRARRSTVDSPCATIINFACSIPPGESRRVGTIDDPMLALVADYTYPVGTQVGVKKDSFFLEKDYCGYLTISTDFDAPTGTLRVKRWEDCGGEMMVKAYECIYPGDMTKQAQPMKWNATSKCWEVDSTKPLVTICDCNKWLLALKDECFKVEGDGCNSGASSDCYRPSFPFGLTRRVIIKQQINPKACGEVTILKTGKNAADCAYPEESDCKIITCNPSGRKLGCDADEMATLNISPGECGTGDQPQCYGWLTPFPRPIRALAVTSNPVCGNTVEINGIGYRDVCDWKHRVEPSTAANPMGLQACANRVVELGWNDCDCQWELTQVPDEPLPNFIRNLSCKPNECIIEKEIWLYPMYGHHCHCDDQQWLLATALQGERVELVSGIETSSGGSGTLATVLTSASVNHGTPGSPECKIEFTAGSFGTESTVVKRKSYCMFCPDEKDGTDTQGPSGVSFSPGGSAGAIIFDQVDVLTEADFYCNPCPELSVRTTRVYALCVQAEGSATASACTCIDCETSSASATPSGTGA